ncbi:hypothetical protein CW700_05595 [Candidatus Bathyarchaeota archaeon]|nr:MAG: hypothetical protein CW700_05595 [Candidatus Bathyarchaeota archaeon]
MVRSRKGPPSPEEFLGFKVGADRKLADWPQIVGYFRELAAGSDRVEVDVLGETTEGNPFIRVIISSPENLSRLEEIRGIQMRICNPVGVTPEEEERLISEGKAIVLITCSIHSTEIAASQMSLELAYRLATEETPEVREILENVILLLVPSLNPDGHQIVVDWYRRTLGTPAEGTPPPWMYHKYVGHDNNRDWFMFTQRETRLAVGEIHNRWHPQIVYDLHQMGRTGPRLFVPPYIDPIDPNVDPILQSEIAFLGTCMQNELITEGKRGVISHCIYDAWTPARAYQHYHGGVRILSEAASVAIATPVEVKASEMRGGRGYHPLKQRWNNPYPWTGGRWTLRDIVEYELSAAFALLRNAARYKDLWLRGSLEIYKRALNPEGGPYAFVFPPAQKDPDTAALLLNTLIFGDVQVHVAKESFEAEGVRYPEGTYVILFAQPYGRFAKTLLEIQEYPDLRDDPSEPPKRPYDITAHTLPLMMHVEVHQIEERFDAELEAVERVTLPEGEVIGEGKPYYIFTPEWNASFKAVNRLLREGVEVFRTYDYLEVRDVAFPPGAFLVEGGEEALASMREMAKDLGLSIYGLDGQPEVAFRVRTPRVGLYRAWSPLADEGWTRFVLENFGFAFDTLTPQEIRQGDLSDRFDVLLFPDYPRDLILKGLAGLPRWMEMASRYPTEYRMGIGRQGVGEVLRFLRDGGTLVTVNGACEFAIKDLSAPAVNAVEGKPPAEFYIPGSILRVLFDTTHPIGYGLDREEAVLFLRSPAFDIKQGESVAVYPEASPLLSGWALGEELLLGKTAVAELPMGDGTAILIGFPPIFRSQAHSTFKVLFNSLLYAAGEVV